MAIEHSETFIRGGWVSIEGRMVPDQSLLRIRDLINAELEKVATTNSGWETLYKDRTDGRYWELFYPHSEMHGGGPESLRWIDNNTASEKYGLNGAHRG